MNFDSKRNFWYCFWNRIHCMPRLHHQCCRHRPRDRAGGRYPNTNILVLGCMARRFVW
jgi:hypothetical protein